MQAAWVRLVSCNHSSSSNQLSQSCHPWTCNRHRLLHISKISATMCSGTFCWHASRCKRAVTPCRAMHCNAIRQPFKFQTLPDPSLSAYLYSYMFCLHIIPRAPRCSMLMHDILHSMVSYTACTCMASYTRGTATLMCPFTSHCPMHLTADIQGHQESREGHPQWHHRLRGAFQHAGHHGGWAWHGMEVVWHGASA